MAMRLAKVMSILFLSLCLPAGQAGFVVINTFAQEIKQPNVSGQFYPSSPIELLAVVDSFLAKANPEPINGEIFALIAPHAGYDYSGLVAAHGYKLIKDKPYKTVIVIGLSHQFDFSGISVYPQGRFRTPLGDIEIDRVFTQKLLDQDPEIFFEPRAFSHEHSVEVQLPFLQRVLNDFKIVPVVMGQTNFLSCKKFAVILKKAIGSRRDVLIVDSVDMYHGYDYVEAEKIDKETASYILNLDADGLYYGMQLGTLQLCGRGGNSVVTTLILAKDLGHNTVKMLKYTNSAKVTSNLGKGVWTVGYGSFVIDQEGAMMDLNINQKKRLLEIARASIKEYLDTGKRLKVEENDPVLNKSLGAFVTLHKHKELRGCIGNMVGTQELYLTIRDMAIESAFSDPRFPSLSKDELKDIEIEVSVLSPLERVDSADSIQMGVHGVLVKKGFRSGVFLPQVATETGWSKEEFLNHLCAGKAGLSPDAWKDKATELYTFKAFV
ncbi:MAG: AmmeMemoRadiSam system protein B, partial [Candidatus Omnitrophota bacterium]